MIELAQGYFRKTVFKTIRWFKHPRVLKHSPVRRWFARHFLSKRVWKPTQHTIAGGFAIGMAVMLQLAPGQMGAAALLAAIFRVNIPIAVMACWISNPFTFVPFVWIQHMAGEWAMPLLPHSIQEAVHTFANWLVGFLEHSPAWVREAVGPQLAEKGVGFIASVYLGGILVGLALIPSTYVLTWLTWEIVARVVKARKARHAAMLKEAEHTQG